MSVFDRHKLERRWSLSRGELVRYAGASLDFNAIHLDDRAARDAGYPGVIAHGMLTLGRVLAQVVDAAGATAIGRCSARFAGPALIGSTLQTRTGEQEGTATRLSVDDVNGQVLDVEVDLGPPPDEEPLDGPVLADRVLVVERGPAARFAEAVGATGTHFYDEAAARREGLAGIPVVPTFAFALPGWGWFPDRQTVGGGLPPDPVRDCRVWTGSDGAVIHAGQDFSYHRPLHVGDVVQATTHEVQRFSKGGRSGALHFTVVATRLTNQDGRAVLTSVMTLLVRELSR